MNSLHYEYDDLSTAMSSSQLATYGLSVFMYGLTANLPTIVAVLADVS